MVRCKSNTRLSSIEKDSRRQAIGSEAINFSRNGLPSSTLIGSDGLPSPVILMQTDTTVGFVSQNHTKLSDIKARPTSKQFITIYNSLQTLKNRIPSSQKSFVRRSKKTTFIIKNRAFRIDCKPKDSQILRNMSWHYSTSANEATKNFQREFCELKADIIIEKKDGLSELSSSNLIKLNNQKIRKLR